MQNQRNSGDVNLEKEAPEVANIALITNRKRNKSSLSKFFVTSLVFWITCFLPCFALIGYDRGNTNLNITALNATRVAPCQMYSKPPVITAAIIQLIQLSESYPVQVTQCEVVVLRHVTRCDIFSHSSEVPGHATFLIRLRETQYKELYQTGSLQIQGSIWFYDLQPLKQHTRVTVLVGFLTPKGRCSEESYADAYGSWQNVVVWATCTITTDRYETVAHTSTDEIKPRSQLTCRYSAGYCIDIEQGDTYWEVNPKEACSKETHIVPYEGNARLITFQDTDKGGNQRVTYSVKEGQKVFATTP